MQLSRIFIATAVATVLVTSFPGSADAAKKDEDDGRVCVRLGMDTNHPLEKVCTRKVATVEASKWSSDKESVHFVFLRSGDAFKSDHIKYSMDGGVKLEPSQLDFCVMEIPAFRGTDEEALAHNNSIATAYYFAAKDSGNDFTGPKSIRFTLRNTNGYFPEGCDVVAATGESWKKSWAEVVEDVSRQSSPNSKFGQKFKEGFTDALNDLALAFSITPAQIKQGHLTAQSELKKAEQRQQEALVENSDLVASASEEGLLFLRFDITSSVLCHNREQAMVDQLMTAPSRSVNQANEWGLKTTKRFEALEDIFSAALAGLYSCSSIYS